MEKVVSDLAIEHYLHQKKKDYFSKKNVFIDFKKGTTLELDLELQV